MIFCVSPRLSVFFFYPAIVVPVFFFGASLLKRSSDAAPESNMTVDGGEYTCKATGNGGFLFASEASRVTVHGAVVSNNVAIRRGGAVSGFKGRGF